jgi:hypothetical protein
VSRAASRERRAFVSALAQAHRADVIEVGGRGELARVCRARELGLDRRFVAAGVPAQAPAVKRRIGGLSLGDIVAGVVVAGWCAISLGFQALVWWPLWWPIVDRVLGVLR